MDTYKIQSYQGKLSNIQINLTATAILFFTLYFSIIESFLLPFELEILILIFTIVILIFNKFVINKKGIIVTNVDVMWLLFLLYFVNSIVFKSLVTPTTFIDMFIYFSAIVFLLFVKVNISQYDSAMKMIRVLGIIYASSSIFQYLYTDIYLNNILPLFSWSEQERVLKLLRDNSYSGFTHQTAYLAGYIVNGIGTLFFYSWKNEKRFQKIITISSLLIMFLGLLLTAKRAHLIFMIIAIIITITISVSNKIVINRIAKTSISALLVIIFSFVIYSSINSDENSPIKEFVNNLGATFTGLLEGEDITSGRTILYRYAYELFSDSPITGIGWKEFINHSVGLINSQVGSHPHNIYLQLLTEIGIVGFVLFMVPVIYFYYKTYRLLRFLSINSCKHEKWRYGVQFSFYSQTFFVLYGLTGNLITDYSFLLFYFFACSISLSAILYFKSSIKL